MLRTAFAALMCLCASPVRAADSNALTPPAPLVAPSGGMTDSEIKAALTKAEQGIEELKRLAGEASHALGEKGATVDTSKNIGDGLIKKFAAECRAGLKAGNLPDPKTIGVSSDEALGSISCKAAVAKSVALCDSLADRKGATEEQSPRDRCTDSARMQMLATAIITGAGPGVCSEAAEAFTEVPAARRQALCRAMVTGDCDQAAAEGKGSEKKKAFCRAAAALKGAKSAQACAALSKSMKSACAASFRAMKDPTCKPAADRLTEESCQETALARVKAMQPDILAQSKKSAVVGPGTAAMEAYKKKRAEVDEILARVDMYTRSAPAGGGDYKNAGPRLKRARAAVAEVEKDLKTVAGAGTGKK